MARVLEITSADFQIEVLGSALPVLVDVYGTYCPPCEQMMPVVEELADEVAGQASVVKLNADENSGLASSLRVRGVPTFIVFKNGEEVGRLTGITRHGPIEALLARGI